MFLSQFRKKGRETQMHIERKETKRLHKLCAFCCSGNSYIPLLDMIAMFTRCAGCSWGDHPLRRRVRTSTFCAATPGRQQTLPSSTHIYRPAGYALCSIAIYKDLLRRAHSPSGCTVMMRNSRNVVSRA